MTNQTINQHVVPRLWLKWFSWNQKQTSTFVYNKIEGNVKGSKKLMDVAVHDNFYDFHPDILKELMDVGALSEGQEQFVEKQFFAYGIEKKFGPLLKNVLNSLDSNTTKKNMISGENRQALSAQLSVQFFRTTALKKCITRILSLINKYAKEKGIKDFEVDVIKEKEIYHYMLMSDLDTLVDFASTLYNRTWTIYKTTSSVPFVISDNPIVVHGTGILGNSICIPLSKNYLLAAHSLTDKNKLVDNCLIDAQPSLVKIFNNLQYCQCDEGVFSSKNDFEWIDKTSSLSPRNHGFSFDLSDEVLEPFIRNLVEKKLQAK